VNAGASFRIAGELHLVDGLAPGRLGPWAREAERGLRPDVTVIVGREDVSSASAGVGRDERRGYRLRSEAFSVDLSPGLESAEVRGAEEAFPVAVRAACRLAAILRTARHGAGLALHASAVVWEGRALVFVGADESGKTTLAQNAARGADAEIIADDLVLLRRGEEGDGRAAWRASGLPWEAARGAEASTPAPLAAAVRIAKGERFSLRPLSGARAAASVLALPPEAFGLDPRPLIVAASRLAEEADVFEAELPPGEEGGVRLIREMGGQRRQSNRGGQDEQDTERQLHRRP
jgi:hypothetical protein